MNNLNRNKIKTKDILQSELEHLYFMEGKTLDEIGHHYGFSDRQPIMRLFKKFGIKTRSKSENARKQSKPIPSADEVSSMIANKSISAAAKEFGYTRQTMTRFVETYGLKPNYFVNKDIRDLIVDSKFDNSSPKEIALELDTEISVVKYYRKNFPKVIYNRDDIIIRLQKYGYDLDNQGLIKQIKFDDANLYDSIIELTKNHKLQSKKLTERIYRIVNKYTENQIECCKHCGKTLIFYTYKLGYGNSDHQICMNCNRKINGVSLISQKLFWDIYNLLNESEKLMCKFSELNNEKKVIVTDDDKFILSAYSKLNKSCYYLDFFCHNKVIEFDGTYYHTDEDKDITKDEFLKLKGYTVFHVKENDYYENSNVVLQKCINFLRQ